MLYWLTGTAASATRLYYENAHATRPPDRADDRAARAGHVRRRLQSASAASPSATTRTSCAGRRSTTAATSPRTRCPTCSSTTSVRSTPGSGPKRSAQSLFVPTVGRLGGVGGRAVDRVVAADRVGVRAAGAGDPLGQQLERRRRPEQRRDRRGQRRRLVDDQPAGRRQLAGSSWRSTSRGDDRRGRAPRRPRPPRAPGAPARAAQPRARRGR